MVPEKQGLKQDNIVSFPFPWTGLSSGSRKTRIETLVDESGAGKRLVSKQWFQKNKDWNREAVIYLLENHWGLSSGSRKTRIEATLALSMTRRPVSLSSGSRKTRIETFSFRKNLERETRSKQWFQKNKDWNISGRGPYRPLSSCLSSGSRKTRIETAASYRYQPARLHCLSSGSRKTRIETKENKMKDKRENWV